MKLQTKAVHAGDRKAAIDQIPVTTPIHLAASYYAESMGELDRIFARDLDGFAYARYGNPTNAALEELVTALEGGAGTLACASGMSALQVSLVAALMDRRKSVVAAGALYGATISLLMKVFEPFGVDINFVDVYDLEALRHAIAETKPGCVVIETVSNPLLRVGAIDRIAEMCRAVGAALVVDNTFATPLLIRPLELGANIVVHSATKYLAGHGDVLGGLVVADEEHFEQIRALSRIYGPVLGPFEAYLTMRGIKTFPLRVERQNQNAAQVAAWLTAHPCVERVYYLDDPKHPDADTIARLLPKGMYGAMVSFELKNAGREQVFAWMDRLKMIVRATSLGDVHTMALYPAISSHREVSPKQRERMGIRDSLVRMSIGIEAVEDIIADLEGAFA
jgi:cystathionine gamma-synthase/methionine-gamma-lyase